MVSVRVLEIIMRSKQKSISYNYSINLANFWLFGWTAIGIFVCSSDLVSLFFGEGYVLPIRIPFIISINFYMVGMQNAVWTYKIRWAYLGKAVSSFPYCCNKLSLVDFAWSSVGTFWHLIRDNNFLCLYQHLV